MKTKGDRIHGNWELDARTVASLRGFADNACRQTPAGDPRQQQIWKKQWQSVYKLCEFWLNTRQELQSYQELEDWIRTMFDENYSAQMRKEAADKIKEMLA